MKTLVLEDVDIKLFRSIRNDSEELEMNIEERHYEIVQGRMNGTLHRSLIAALMAEPLLKTEEDVRAWDEVMADIRG
ncbi:hypothetical protein [Cupriavidus plantarum]|uniref:Uncharacterized protein n=1 Tax=Cupriavidus plantarum TaxID=942865 RepID=A0A316EX23_9BURK|nr:hypothetical protein [Cupriavidus plantarum]PWK35493.1 hypothetical protein C7419_102771 [Cupriavidus plantarum]